MKIDFKYYYLGHLNITCLWFDIILAGYIELLYIQEVTDHFKDLWIITYIELEEFFYNFSTKKSKSLASFFWKLMFS